MKHFPRIILFIIALIFLCSDPVFTQRTYRERADSVVAFFRDTDYGKDYFFAIAKLHSGKNVDQALRYLDTLFRQPQGDAYWMLSTMGVFLHGQKHLPDTYKKRLRELWKTYTPLCQNSEHERVLYYSSLFLASEWFTGENGEEWFNGKTRKENHTDAQSFLEFWFREATEKSVEEFDSPTRTGFYLATMFLLRDFAREASMRTRAEIMITWLLADFAAEYLDGMYCGAHSAEHERFVIDPRSSTMTTFGALLWSDKPPVYSSEILLMALSDYQPPNILTRVAVDRGESFVHQEQKYSTRFLRGSSQRRKEIQKYTYMTEDYAMGSMDQGFTQPIEQHSWDVSWKSQSDATSIFGVQPFAHDTTVSMFYPQTENQNLFNLSTEYLRYVTFNKNSGGSPYERLFQHRNTLIGLYDIPAIKTFPILTAFFPKTKSRFIADSLKSKWIFFESDEKNVFVAYYPFKKYQLLDEEFGKRFISPHALNGFICQVASKREVGSFQQFMAKIKKSKIDLSKFESEKIIRYATIHGERMEFSFAGTKRINEKDFIPDRNSLFSSKWMQSKKGSGVLTITDGKKVLTLDMKNVMMEER